MHGDTICLPNLRLVIQARDELTPVSVAGRILESLPRSFAVGQPTLSPTSVAHKSPPSEPRREDFIPEAELRPILLHGASCIARN